MLTHPGVCVCLTVGSGAADIFGFHATAICGGQRVGRAGARPLALCLVIVAGAVRLVIMVEGAAQRLLPKNAVAPDRHVNHHLRDTGRRECEGAESGQKNEAHNVLLCGHSLSMSYRTVAGMCKILKRLADLIHRLAEVMFV